MPITPYTGQPLAPGMLVCRQSMLTWGICSRPIEIVSVSGSRLRVRDPRDAIGAEDERTIYAKTIAFIVDTMEEGNALCKASSDFLERERQIQLQVDTERAARRRAVIASFTEPGGAS